MTDIRWYVVMLPGESVDLSEMYGPFRSEAQADEVCARWNADNISSDEATVMPIYSAKALR